MSIEILMTNAQADQSTKKESRPFTTSYNIKCIIYAYILYVYKCAMNPLCDFVAIKSC